MLLVFHIGNAQNIAFNSKMIDPSLIASLSSDSSAQPAASTKASVISSMDKSSKEFKHYNRAMVSFGNEFKDAQDVKWGSNAEGFTASFTKADTRNVIYYTKNGAQLYRLTSYSGDKLAADIQQKVHDAFAGYKITWVDEVHHFNDLIYVVHLENDQNIKLVLVADDEITIYREYAKGR